MTFEVLKLDKSNEVNNTHSQNIHSISVTCEVSNLDKSNEIKDEQ